MQPHDATRGCICEVIRVRNNSLEPVSKRPAGRISMQRKNVREGSVMIVPEPSKLKVIVCAEYRVGRGADQQL